MPRLFIAIALPAAIRTQLAALKSPLPGARWVKVEQAHLTLRFIGEVDADRAQQIATALADVQASAFELNVHGVGYFPPRRAPRVLWAGVLDNPRLQQLYGAVERALRGVGVAPESRPFAAHITLARLDNASVGGVQQFVTHNSGLKLGPFAAREFLLYASELQSSGAVYRCLATYSLQAPGHDGNS